MIDTSEILFVNPNKNRTDAWLRASGLQLPVGLTKYDSISKVTYYDDVVNNMNDKKTNRYGISNGKSKEQETVLFQRFPI
ncbi:hypothetical protein [Anaerovorax odorimutans]|uniref:hypothetical protein n=1 Tax=Anaerovorax odorimutans TaxID=109327 RepID=UPI002108DA75|nr:hypothetical protein [Anaerovorax odorimutans]